MGFELLFLGGGQAREGQVGRNARKVQQGFRQGAGEEAGQPGSQGPGSGGLPQAGNIGRFGQEREPEGGGLALVKKAGDASGDIQDGGARDAAMGEEHFPAFGVTKRAWAGKG